MKWLNNMKFKQKFITILGTILVLVLFFGVSAIYAVKYVNNSYQKTIVNNETTVKNSMDIVGDITNIRIVAYGINPDENTTSTEYIEMEKNLDASYQKAKDSIEGYKKTFAENDQNQEEEEAITNISKYLDEYYNGMKEFISLSKQGKFQEAKAKDNALTPVGENLFTSIYDLPKEAFHQLVIGMESIGKLSDTRVIGLIILFIIIVLIATFLGTNLSLSIRKPVGNLTVLAEEISKGNFVDIRSNSRDEVGTLSNSIANMVGIFESILDDIKSFSENFEKGNLSYRINSNKYKGTFKQATEAINETVEDLLCNTDDIVNTISEIGNGNFEVQVKDMPGDKAIAFNSIKQVQNAVKSVSNEINNLINAAIDGNLEYKIDTTKYKGEWKDTTEGLNLFIENIVIPIKETQNALNQFSKGNFAHRITNEYKGEFNNIKETVNFTAETIGSYI
ncbi:MAG: MCP four helix bundle domain-containing protein, partial [Eubacteriales bacterium]|nr:MCP four helix bundle domain-containing protein [Eubacteriales bacterium]